MAGEQTCPSFHINLYCIGKKICNSILSFYRFDTEFFCMRVKQFLFSATFLALWLSLTGYTEEVGRVPGLFPGLDRVPVWV